MFRHLLPGRICTAYSLECTGGAILRGFNPFPEHKMVSFRTNCLFLRAYSASNAIHQVSAADKKLLAPFMVAKYCRICCVIHWRADCLRREYTLISLMSFSGGHSHDYLCRLHLQAYHTWSVLQMCRTETCMPLWARGIAGSIILFSFGR